MMNNKLKKVTRVMAVAASVILVGSNGITGNAATKITVGAERVPSKYVSGWVEHSERGHQLKVVINYKKIHNVTGKVYSGTKKEVMNGDYKTAATCETTDGTYKFTVVRSSGYVDGNLIKTVSA